MPMRMHMHMDMHMPRGVCSTPCMLAPSPIWQVLNERLLLGDVDHPFIAKLHASLKTRWSLYLVCVCVRGACGLVHVA